MKYFSKVPKSGAEYAYLFETFSKMHKFWGPLPSFICNWVYVMVLRPAEVAILILICVTYAFEPFRHQIGLDTMDENDKQNLYKLLAMATLCKIILLQINERILKKYHCIFWIYSSFSHCNIHQFAKCKIVCYNQQYLQLWEGSRMRDCYSRRNIWTVHGKYKKFEYWLRRNHIKCRKDCISFF